MSKKLFLSSVAVPALLFWADAALAQQADASADSPAAEAGQGGHQGFADIIVTARRVEENLQRVPTSVTAVDPDSMRRESVLAVKDLQKLAPSLSIASYFNDMNARFAVRGLAAGVTTYFAEAPCCGGIASAPFLDIASIQVLNGPQGTLFGRSSAAGAVLITPEKPKLNDWGGMVDMTVGTYGRVQATGVVNIPVIEDHLAIRFAANANRVGGYTKQFGTSKRLDDVNNQQYRLGIAFKAGGFENTLFASYENIDQSATGMVLSGYKPTYAFPDNDSDPTNANGYLLALQQEAARLAQGGSKAARITAAPYDGQAQYTQMKHASVVNNTQLDAIDTGPTKISFKNIFSFDSFTSNSAGSYDGVGGILQEGAFAAANYSNFGSNNQVGTRLAARIGPALHTYTEELQMHAELWDGLVKANVGGFYQYQRAPENMDGTTNVYKLFSNPAGYVNAVGFIKRSVAKEKAVFGQATLDLSKVGIAGLSLTGGYRYSWSDAEMETITPVKDPATGTFVPGTTSASTHTKSKGYNYTLSVQQQFTRDIMGYVTATRAYVPGGVNAIGQVGQALPGYKPIYDSATVNTQEIGLKTQFYLGDVAVRLNGAAYNTDYKNIAQQLLGLVNGVSYRYLANIAAAQMRGAEVAGSVVFDRSLTVNFGYSYNHAKYKKWTGADPFNVAKPGDSVCVPESPTGVCFLDLSNNPLPYMPEHSGNVTLLYNTSLGPKVGELGLSASLFTQSRVFYVTAAARDLQLYPGGLEAISQAAYSTVNLRAELRDVAGSGWNTAVFVTNLTDKLYATGKVAQLHTLGFSAANYAPPRMVGLQVWKKF
ncbi:TonB-dependent receptor [Sphingomonas sp.]|uniref:TonB-dependent receptor n=1 Tax=Sphingomonas sp. TaxID=28214 RepID=UPI002C1B77CC|nr:TonB-dependent receptor [Sphingomonas sp.]HWK35912.1 TonB-dependent receptor [Sphingomonas sp.]